MNQCFFKKCKAVANPSLSFYYILRNLTSLLYVDESRSNASTEFLLSWHSANLPNYTSYRLVWQLCFPWLLFCVCFSCFLCLLIRTNFKTLLFYQIPNPTETHPSRVICIFTLATLNILHFALYENKHYNGRELDLVQKVFMFSAEYSLRLAAP